MAEEDFKISKKEANQLREALKKPEFCKLLAEYAEEISDPENKKKYEEELVALEKQRGVDMKYIHPQAGFVMKAFLKPECTRKLFINICFSDVLEPATSRPSAKTSKKGRGEHWNIPYSLSPPRDDLDKSKNKCTVVDVIFHTEIFKRTKEETRFKQLLIDCALEGLERQLQLVVERSKIIHLQMPYKGVPSPAVIRTRMDDHDGQDKDGANSLNIPFPPLPDEVHGSAPSDPTSKVDERNKKSKSKQETKPPTEPKYTVVHRGEFSMQDYTNDRHSTLVRRPKELLVKVEVPGVSSAAILDVEVFEKRVVLKCKSPCYELDLALAYPVDEDHSSAKFDKSAHVLFLTLPVLPPKTEPLQPPSPVTSAPVSDGTTMIEQASVNRLGSKAKEEEDSVPGILSRDAVHGEEQSVQTSANPLPCEVCVSERERKEVPPTQSSSVTSVNSSGEPLSSGAMLKTSQGAGDSPRGVTGISPSRVTLGNGRNDHGDDDSAGVTGTSSSDQVGEVTDWSCRKHQACPPFSYRQDDDVVVFCLHTSGVKEGSLVKLFDTTSVQLTYSTSTVFYSFHVSFPDGCVLDVDDCTVDVSQENVVLLLKKDDTKDDSRGMWEKCYVGPNAVHTAEKLFLTNSNVQSVVHNLPDPWKQTVWSEHAKVAANLAADGEQVTLTICDPSSSTMEPSQSDPAASCNTTVEGPRSGPSVPTNETDGDAEGGDKLKESSGNSGADLLHGRTDVKLQSESCTKQDHSGITDVERLSGEVASDVTTSGGTSSTVTSAETSQSVKVEADGSVFICADESYLRDRNKTLPVVEGKRDPEPPGNQLRLSNDLLYSLD